MLTAGQTLSLKIEKPAVGGRMIARANGQVVLVAGAIPGEQVEVTIERVTKGVAYARTTKVEEPSSDRRQPEFEPHCGGCLYAYVDYPRQLTLKAEVIGDALLRIGRLPWPEPVIVRASPPVGYRMRARLHWRQQRIGFFIEGSHQICDARPTQQLAESSSDVLARVARGLRDAGLQEAAEVELSENADASERAIHVEATAPFDVGCLSGLVDGSSLTGLTVSMGAAARPSLQILGGDPHVTDRVAVGDRVVTLRRHVLAFFQGNRFLLQPLVSHISQMIVPGSRVLDLYAGVGLFSVAAAARGASVTAVEGDQVSSNDLVANGSPLGVNAVGEAVEGFVRRSPPVPDMVIVDPPRTGLSREALDGVIRLGAAQVVYVSCDIATFARDTRRLLDAGYRLTQLDGFDLFPNTPHVETIARFSLT